MNENVKLIKGSTITLPIQNNLNKMELSSAKFCMPDFYGKIKVYGIEDFNYLNTWFTTIFLEYRGDKYIIKNRREHMFLSSLTIEKVNKFILQSLLIPNEKINFIICKILENPELYMTSYNNTEDDISIEYGNDFSLIYNKQEDCLEMVKFNGKEVPTMTLLELLEHRNGV